MKANRREFLVLNTAAALTLDAKNQEKAQIKREKSDTATHDRNWNAQWIWYPGQLAAYRHSRRMRLALARCAFVGYPANFRQPLTEAYFRVSGTADRDIHLRWAAPVARVRTTIGGRGGDITTRERVFRAGESNLLVQLDFAQSLPCLLLEGGAFSTGPNWEASLDGEHWVPAETSSSGDPHTLPDAEREIKVSLPVYRTITPQGEPRDRYRLTPASDLLVDFRETEIGSIRFHARGRGDLTVQVGESIPEVQDPDTRSFEQYPIPKITLTPDVREIVLPQRAFRFARISASKEAEVTDLHFDALIWPAEQKGRFESSDPGLNAIWTVAVATLRSNMHDFYLDGIRRDALLWHDGPLTLDAYERVFFDADLSRQTLVAETMPAHPSARDLGIIDSPMYDVVGFEREFLVRGDASFSRMFRERIDDILQFFLSIQDKRGFVNAVDVQPYGFFPDWSATGESGPDGHGAPAYGQMLLAAAFAAGERLARAWNDQSTEAKYRDAAAQLKASIRETFWSPREGLYYNGLDRNGKLDTRFTSFAQAFAIAYQIAKPGEYSTLFQFLNDYSKRPPHFSLSQVVELTAYAQAGRAEDALRRLKFAWLPIIKRGYLRFPEDIDPAKSPTAQLAMYGRKYATSLCHAWAGAAPVMALSRGVLGIEPIQPGYITCAISPQRCGLDWVRGAVPTPHGTIEIEWHGSKGTLTLPEGVTARLTDGRLVNGPGHFQIDVSG